MYIKKLSSLVLCSVFFSYFTSQCAAEQFIFEIILRRMTDKIGIKIPQNFPPLLFTWIFSIFTILISSSFSSASIVELFLLPFFLKLLKFFLFYKISNLRKILPCTCGAKVQQFNCLSRNQEKPHFQGITALLHNSRILIRKIKKAAESV